jgi:pyruvate dehydrogenase E1 component alpha subunit
VSQFRCNVYEDDTTDAERIYALTCDAIKAIRQTQKPSFLCLKYYRYLEHVGVHEDFGSGYRAKDELEEWLRRDPVELLRRKLLDRGIEEEKIHQVYRSLKLAKEAPFPKERELYEGIFA